MQHGTIRLVFDGAQSPALLCRGFTQQGEGLVRMRGYHHFVKVLDGLAGEDAHATSLISTEPFDPLYRCVQAFVGNSGNNFVHVVPGTALHRPPLGAVAYLNQAMVVTEPDHRGYRKLQHLVGGATPDAGHHRQEIPVTKLLAEAMFIQEIAQRLCQLCFLIAFGDTCAQRVKPGQIAQHAQKAPVQQIPPLGENRIQAGATPLQFARAIRRLHGKRHIRFGGFHAQFGKQVDQVGIGALIEHQKSGVDAKRPGLTSPGSRQRDIDRVGVATKIVAGLKQRDVGFSLQLVGNRQARDA